MIHPGSVYIVRIEGNRTRAWQVRIYGENEKYRSKLFSDGVYGDKQKAQIAAIKYHKACLKKIPKKILDRQARSKQYGRTWGPGIYFFERRRNNMLEQAWIGFYSDPVHGQARRYFSCKRYGHNVAKRLAKHFSDMGNLKKAKFGLKLNQIEK